MESWRERFTSPREEPEGLPFAKYVRIRLTGSGAVAVADHARSRGLSREEWIRRAIAEQMEREGALSIPEMKPYTGHRMLREVPGG